MTGATGVSGRGVVERLNRAGHEVVAVARRPPLALPAGARFVGADVTDLAALTAAMDGCEVVCHLAPVSGTANVCAAMKRTGARRLVVASSALSDGANLGHVTDTAAAEQVVLDSGVEAVLARTGLVVGRNIDQPLALLAAPVIVAVKGVELRYQLLHHDDLGRFLAIACESGPPGVVDVAPPDALPLRQIAQLLGRKYVETSATRALKAIEFAWKHDLPGMDTTRLREVWGFECAWSTAEGVADLRRAVSGVSAVAGRRVEVPWRLRFPTHRPGPPVSTAANRWPDFGAPAGELDSPIPLAYPTVSRLGGPAPLAALTLSTHLQLLRAASRGMLDAFGGAPEVRRELGDAGAASIAHRLYVNDDVAYAVEHSGGRRRVVGRAYGREVDRIAGWAAESLEHAANPAACSDARLDAVLGRVLDDLAWFWAIAAIGAALGGDELGDLAHLLVSFPDGVSPNAAPAADLRDDGGHSRARMRAERVVRALAQALAALVRERADRLLVAGAVRDPADVAHLTWEELLVPPPDLTDLVKTRRAEQQRLAALVLPSTMSVNGSSGALTVR
ncbi:hypothetical protein GCM10009547_23620 [Sporichthya brevicatena]|uniref:NAD(P)-binding domain-containing protein n=1 Tax=Sporichthya brevicatena TaxID=171442 RepID=A0ABP3RXQ7_9ACTN